jgi:ATP synthase F1 gamma subunit
VGKVEILKNSLKSMSDLEDLTNVLEQVAARDIALMREQILQSRPFFREVWRVHQIMQELSPPPPEVVHKHLVVAIALDWGMPGDLLNRTLKKSQELYEEHGADLLIAGKMGHARFKGRDERTIHYFGLPKKLELREIQSIYKIIANYAHVSYVYPKFETLSKQVVAVASSSVTAEVSADKQEGQPNDIKASRFIIEPGPQDVANYMNAAITGLTVYHYFNEASLAYSAAQMVAMRNAYDNARTETGALRNKYQKARRELIDSKLRELYGSRPAASGRGF